MAEGQNPKRQSLEDIVNRSSQGGGGTPAAGEGQASGSGSKPGEGDRRGRADDVEGPGGRPANGLIIAGLICGVLSVVGALLIPIIGLPLGIAAFVLGLLARKKSKDRRAIVAMVLGGLGVALSIAVFGLVAGGGGGDENADAVVSCLKDADLGDVKSRKTSKAEDIDALKDAAKKADEFVSATDAEGRDVYVLLFKSKKRAKRARDDVSGDREVGVRGKNLLIYSSEIGPENRTKIEGCFL